MTTGQLSAVVNFVGTLLLFALVDPYLSYLTDTTAAGETPQSRLRLHVAAMGFSRLLGTVPGAPDSPTQCLHHRCSGSLDPGMISPVWLNRAPLQCC